MSPDTEPIRLARKFSRGAELQSGAGRVIYLRERSLSMLKKEIVLKNPLRLIGGEAGHILPKGGFGAVLARAGVGKTAVLVQIALDSLLRETNVLHISLDQPVSKVCLWYEEVFNHVGKHYQLNNTVDLWDAILPHRFIMTFNTEGFSIPRLEERITDLTEQGIFYPQVVLVDGLSFDQEVRELLNEMKLVARENELKVWFAVRIHREDISEEKPVPDNFMNVADLFDAALQLSPQGPQVMVNPIKTPGELDESISLYLDPASLLIKDGQPGE
ncbi:AAA domain-containing protein [Desulfatibacillum alkenivorans DSM 16219]|uniref:AAA domain-containing protein n=1 Tax=Desulfatibacillum alkenivorans DSM 16219 TaxID=1121393 RepID=A0A1M6L2K4_9BACT|nr:AAA domain-containing protein [Desulfatibacillum alkenivorans DSM 16219]